MEDILQSSYKFTDHPLQKINTPHFIRKKGKRSNLLDLLTWYYYKNKTVSWDLFGPELENYCQAIDMQAIPYYGSYRCGFSFSDSQIAHFLRSRESIPEIFNVKLLEAALTADGSLLQIMEPIHQRNEQLALASIKTYKAPWKFIDEKLRKNPSFIFAALQINGRILSYLSKESVEIEIMYSPHSNKTLQLINIWIRNFGMIWESLIWYCKKMVYH